MKGTLDLVWYRSDDRLQPTESIIGIAEPISEDIMSWNASVSRKDTAQQPTRGIGYKVGSMECPLELSFQSSSVLDVAGSDDLSEKAERCDFSKVYVPIQIL